MSNILRCLFATFFFTSIHKAIYNMFNLAYCMSIYCFLASTLITDAFSSLLTCLSYLFFLYFIDSFKFSLFKFKVDMKYTIIKMRRIYALLSVNVSKCRFAHDEIFKKLFASFYQLRYKISETEVHEYMFNP